MVKFETWSRNKRKHPPFVLDFERDSHADHDLI